MARHTHSSNRYLVKTMRCSTVALLLAVAAFVADVHAADQQGWFGLAFSVESEGFSFNPTIRSVTIAKVAPSSPGAGAGLVAGDTVVALQGVATVGAKADVLKSAMKKSVGETLRVKIKRGTAEPFEASLVAITKPSSG
jgi:predicted metalloprotease with PDZ domain